MKKPRSLQVREFLRIRVIFLFFLIPYFIFSFVTFTNYGIAIDEPIEYGFGQMLYARTFGHDPILIRDFAVEHENSREIWAYNHFHAMLLYMVNDSASIEVYHLLNLLFGILGFYLAFELVYLASRSAPLSLIGPLFLFFTPRFLGDLPSNVKDPVFAIYYVLALTAIAFLPKYRVSALRIICVGATIGLAAAARVLGYGLIPIYFIFFTPFILKSSGSWKKKTVSWLIELGSVSLTAVAIHAVEMPFVAANPLVNLIRLFEIGKAYPWQGEMLYLGGMVRAGSLPWHYIFVWAGIITPVYLLFLWLLSNMLWKEKVIQLLNVTFWFNVALYFVLKPTIYDGIRHLLFLLVIMSILASVTWVRLWQKRKGMARILLAVTLGLYIGSVSLQYVRLHPYEYAYFNEIIGGLPGAAEAFETDYWGTSYKEATSWLTTTFGSQKAIVGLCGNKEAAIYFAGTSLTPLWLPHCEDIAGKNVDYVIVFGRNEEWEKVRGTTIHTISREGVPFVKVIQL